MVRNFYYEKYNKIELSDLNPSFVQATSGFNETTGYFSDKTDGLPFKVGNFTGSSLKYVEPGALVKLVPPAGFYFADNGTLTTNVSTTTTDRLWAKVVSVVGDGSASGRGVLSSGLGPIAFNEIIPTDSLLKQVIPRFISNLPDDLESLMVDLIFNYRNFGLRYDTITRSWQVVYDRNLNLLGNWSLGKAGDNSGQKLDSSCIIAFETEGELYKVSYR